MDENDLPRMWSCARCGAIVHEEFLAQHREWHMQLEGTIDPVRPRSS
jgi:hypothetical protein